MKISSVFCDVCGNPIPGEYVKFYLHEGMRSNGSEFEDVNTPHEICTQCAGDLLSEAYGKNATLEQMDGTLLSVELIAKMNEIKRKFAGGVK